MDHIKFIGVGRITDESLLVKYIPEKKNKAFSEEVCLILYFNPLF
jgi:hypothetical protein